MYDPLLDYRARLIDRLEAVVPELADTVAAIPEARWRQPIRPGTRSPHALTAHLRDLEREAYLARLQQLLLKEQPDFETWDSPNWESDQYNPVEPLADILADYAGLREAELQLLRPLQPKDWVRLGRHPTFGLRTLQWWAERILEYTEDQIRELRTTEQ